MHVIRLRRPWEKCLEGSTDSYRIDVPELEVAEVATRGGSADRGADVHATFVYRRSFNTPSGLSESSRVFLRVTGWQGRLESATLNGCPMEHNENSIEADVTGVLKPNNQIEVRLNDTSVQWARLSGEVMLAIDDD